MKKIRAIDLFCGAGGSSWGLKRAGVSIVAGFDASLAAGQVYRENFPRTKFVPGRLEELNPKALRRQLGFVDLIVASPECTSHSRARGAAEGSEASRETAFQVSRFAAAFVPRWIIIENVANMRRWSRYEEFTLELTRLGYHIREQSLNAADFGVPQSRRRLFLLCDRVVKPKPVTRRRIVPENALSFIDMNGRYQLTPLRKERRATATLARADRAIAAVGLRRPFLLVYYGSDKAGGWQQLDRPLRTVTTLDRFALVRPAKGGHEMRMLQVPELKRAMGMPHAFSVGSGSRREQIRLIGNAVCPPVMEAVIRSLRRQ